MDARVIGVQSTPFFERLCPRMTLSMWRGLWAGSPAVARSAKAGTKVPPSAFLARTQFGRRLMSILWLIIIGFVAGIIAKFLHPGSNEPAGFILTTALGIAGAFVATYLGQALGWYRADEGAGLIGAVVGAVIVLVVWGFFARRSTAT
jgi:uncharacterized membrane protein YeaQ/YmgE (transglycosylase-associated protein family)